MMVRESQYTQLGELVNVYVYRQTVNTMDHSYNAFVPGQICSKGSGGGRGGGVFLLWYFPRMTHTYMFGTDSVTSLPMQLLFAD